MGVSTAPFIFAVVVNTSRENMNVYMVARKGINMGILTRTHEMLDFNDIIEKEIYLCSNWVLVP